MVNLFYGRSKPVSNGPLILPSFGMKRWTDIPATTYSATPVAHGINMISSVYATTIKTNYVGYPIRYRYVNDTTLYYAIITSVISSSVVCSGPAFDTAKKFETIWIGSQDCLLQVNMTIPGAFAKTVQYSLNVNVAKTVMTYKFGQGFICGVGLTAVTGSGSKLMATINNVDVATTTIAPGFLPSSNSLTDILVAKYAIKYDDVLDVRCAVADTANAGGKTLTALFQIVLA